MNKGDINIQEFDQNNYPLAIVETQNSVTRREVKLAVFKQENGRIRLKIATRTRGDDMIGFYQVDDLGEKAKTTGVIIRGQMWEGMNQNSEFCTESGGLMELSILDDSQRDGFRSGVLKTLGVYDRGDGEECRKYYEDKGWGMVYDLLEKSVYN